MGEVNNVRLPQWIVQTFFAFMLSVILAVSLNINRRIGKVETSDAVQNEKLIQNEKDHRDIMRVISKQ